MGRHWQPNHNPYARPNAFKRPDMRGMGTELEVSQLLAAHVRWLKPRVVVETGTYKGDTAVSLYSALVNNAREGFSGELRTYDPDPEALTVAKQRLAKVKSHKDAKLTIIEGCLGDAPPTEVVDLAFVDSAYDARGADVEVLAPLMAPMGLLFVHDARMPQMRELVKSWWLGWDVVEYPTARGLALLSHWNEFAT